jgi:hypothetical protein
MGKTDPTVGVEGGDLMNPNHDQDERADDAEATTEDDPGSGSEQAEQGTESGDEQTSGATEEDEAKEEMRRIEEDPPENLEDWPQGKAKYETYGGPEGRHGYHEGPEEKLGPSSVRHHEGGDVSIEGEKVDNPEEYKGDPIPGGPTDPNAPDQPGEREKETEDGDDDG